MLLEWAVPTLLGVLLLLAALVSALMHPLLWSIRGYIGFSLLLALAWAWLGAVGLALAEAVIGAVLTGALLMLALSRQVAVAPASVNRLSGPTRVLLLAGCLLLSAVLAWTLWQGPKPHLFGLWLALVWGLSCFTLVNGPELLRRVIALNLMGAAVFSVLVLAASQVDAIDSRLYGLVLMAMVIALGATALALWLIHRLQAESL